MTDACAALKPLADLDPDLACRLQAACRQAPVAHIASVCQEIVSTLIACFGCELHFGQAVVDGYEALLARGSPAALAAYGAAVRSDGRHGAGLGRVTAVFLPSVLLTEDPRLLAAYNRTVAVLRAKGAYLLPAPLDGLRWLLAKEDRTAAVAYLGLLETVFKPKLSYNRCQYLGNLLPRSLRRMPVSRRNGQLRQLARLAATDLRLIEPFLDGLDRGLALLTEPALERFNDQALALAPRYFEKARRFMALRSDHGRAAYQALQTAIPLTQVRPGLHRYLQARIGRQARLEPLGNLPGITDEARLGAPQAACDGIAVYLPEEIDHHANDERNAGLYKILVKFEASQIEYGTFGFDLARACDQGQAAPLAARNDEGPGAGADDLRRFIDGFTHRRLALDLLTLFEHARLRVRLEIDYPGLVRHGIPVLQTEFLQHQERRHHSRLLDAAYARLALGLPSEAIVWESADELALVQCMQKAFERAAPAQMPVESAAGLVTTFYPRMVEALAVGRQRD